MISRWKTKWRPWSHRRGVNLQEWLRALVIFFSKSEKRNIKKQGAGVESRALAPLNHYTTSEPAAETRKF